MLVGTVVTSLWPALTGGALSPLLWLLVIVGAVSTVVVDKAVFAFLQGVRANYLGEKEQRLDLGVPGFTLPFNMVGWVVWAVLLRVEHKVTAAIIRPPSVSPTRVRRQAMRI